MEGSATGNNNLVSFGVRVYLVTLLKGDEGHNGSCYEAIMTPPNRKKAFMAIPAL